MKLKLALVTVMVAMSIAAAYGKDRPALCFDGLQRQRKVRRSELDGLPTG